MALCLLKNLKADTSCWPKIDLRFRFRNYQRAAWPLAAWIEEKCNGLFFYNDTPLLFIGKGDFHLLQHILTTKVDAEHIPNTRLGSKESKSAGKVRYKCFNTRLIYQIDQEEQLHQLIPGMSICGPLSKYIQL